MITNRDWKRYIYALSLEGAKNGKKVKSLEYELVANDIRGNFNITDLQIQEGKKPSGTIPHVSDFLEKLYFNIDERYYMSTVTNAVKQGVQPVYHENISNRFYNIIGRGHEAVVIPNVFHEDYTKKVVTTALDLTLYPKEDYDLLRISTNDGALIDGRYYKDIPDLVNHPLNIRYTREFFFNQGLAGDKIELKTTIRSAKIIRNDVEYNIPINAHTITTADKQFKIGRQRLMIAPAGSFRVRIEFYKSVTETLKSPEGIDTPYTYLKDIGIGYYGQAELTQWTYGRSKL